MTVNTKKTQGIRRIYLASLYSAKGLQAAWKHEAAFRQECLLTIVMLPLSFWVGQNWLDYVLLIACLFIVLITELLNSAIEAVVDRVSTEHHELSGRAKDLGSAAVFCALVLTVFIWSIVCWKNFF